MTTRYTTKGPLYEMVCDHLGWLHSVCAVKVRETPEGVRATGTLLKPQEWRSLYSHHGDTLPDGRTLHVVIPPHVRRAL